MTLEPLANKVAAPFGGCAAERPLGGTADHKTWNRASITSRGRYGPWTLMGSIG
jgi:hypothetical protein